MTGLLSNESILCVRLCNCIFKLQTKIKTYARNVFYARLQQYLNPLVYNAMVK